MKKIIAFLFVFAAAMCSAQQSGLPAFPVSGSAISPNPSASQFIAQPYNTILNSNTQWIANVNNVWDVDGFTTALFPGIGVAGTGWVSATTYPSCQEVSYSGGNYLYTGFLTNTPSTTTPGTNSQAWYPISNGTRPTQLDCAFYTAAASIVSTTGTVTTGGLGAALILGVGTYNTGIGLTNPTVPNPGNGTVSIFGRGQTVSVIMQNTMKGDGLPTIYQPNSTIGYAFANFTWQGFTVNSNFLANAVSNIYGASGIVIRDVQFLNPIDFNDHSVEMGNASNTPDGWVFQPQIDNITISNNRGSGKGANITATVSGGVPSFDIVSGGTQYNFWGADTTATLTGTADFGRPCNSMGTTTLTITSGVITDITSTATGCTAPLYVQVTGIQNIAYGLKLSNVSDSQFINAIQVSNVGTTAGMEINNISAQLTISKYHPDGMPTGVVITGSGITLNSLQCDTIQQYCMNIGGAGVTNVIAPLFEWSNETGWGSYSDYYFPNSSGVPGYSEPQAVNIYGEACGNQASFAGYAHFTTTAGPVDSSGGLPTYVHDTNPIFCNIAWGSTGVASQVNPSFLGQQIQLTNGVVGNQWNLNLGTSALSGGPAGSQTMIVTQANSSATNYIGEYGWDWSNITPATSGNNYASPLIGQFGTYWNGSASVPFGVTQELTFGTGSTPTATYKFQHNGTIPTSLGYSFDEPITVPSCTGCGGGGSGTVSGQASGVVPLGTAATTIGAQSHLDDGVTTTGTITSSEPLGVSGAGLFGASTYYSLFQSAVNGSAGSAGSCALSAVTPGKATTAAVLGCAASPAAGTGTLLNVGGDFAAYSQDSSMEPVAGLFFGTALANSVNSYGINVVDQDVSGLTSGVVLSGQENDLQPNNPVSAYSSGTGYRAVLAYTHGNTGNYPFDALGIGTNVPGAEWRTAITTGVGSVWGEILNINALGAATSGTNYNCPTLLDAYEAYWTGSANAYEGWQLACFVGTGTNPQSDFFKIQRQGTAPSGQTHYFDFTGGINIELDGSTSGSAYLAASTTGGALNITAPGGVNFSASRKGTFVCTSAGTITIANTNELVTSDVIISLNTAAGTISTAPAMKTVTSGTGFTVLCGAADTSTYNYDILN